jgi:hypothetical protein
VQLAAVAGALLLAASLLFTAGSPWALGAVTALTGAAVPPLIVLCSVLAESAVHPAVLTETFSWLGSASAAGSAAAAALSGWAVDAAGPGGGFALAVTAAAAITAQGLAGLRLLPVAVRRPTRPRRD